MAGTNKLIKYGTWSLGTDNTYTDDELVALTTTEKQGIELGSIAYSDILNGLMRQLTHTNKAFSDLVVAKAGADVNTGITEATYSNRIELAIENIAKEVTITRLTSEPTSGETAASALAISGDTLRSGITFSVDGLIKSVVRLQVGDLPTIGTGTFLGRTASGSGTPSAISAANVRTAISAVPTTREIAGLSLAENRSRDDIIGVSSNGFVTRTGVNTYGIDATSYTPTSREIAGLDLTADRSRDDIIGITDTSGVVVKTGDNTYGVSDAYALDADVAYKVSDSPVDPTFWVGTQAQYDALTPDSDVIYIIT